MHNLGASPTPSYIRVRAIVSACGRGQTHGQTQTDRQTHRHTQRRMTTIHFASSTTHAKCNCNDGQISNQISHSNRTSLQSPTKYLNHLAKYQISNPHYASKSQIFRVKALTKSQIFHENKSKNRLSTESFDISMFDALHFRYNHTRYTSYNHVHVVNHPDSTSTVSALNCIQSRSTLSVSYTHLTLPTILRV